MTSRTRVVKLEEEILIKPIKIVDHVDLMQFGSTLVETHFSPLGPPVISISSSSIIWQKIMEGREEKKREARPRHFLQYSVYVYIHIDYIYIYITW